MSSAYHDDVPPAMRNGCVREIPLQRGMAALVDDQDYATLSQHRWTAVVRSGIAYARRYPAGSHKPVLMHRVILNAPPGIVVDHINGNGLDNRRCNIRLATPAQNSHNHRPIRKSSAFTGVCFVKERMRWSASINRDGRPRKIGYFFNEAEAAAAYDRVAVALWGEFARPNFKSDEERAAAIALCEPRARILERAAKEARDRAQRSRSRRNSGNRNPNARLTLAAVRELRDLFRRGARARELSERFGIHVSHVRDIVAGHRWAEDAQ